MVHHVAAPTMIMVTVTPRRSGPAGYDLAPLLLDLPGVAPHVYTGALGFRAGVLVRASSSSFSTPCSRR